MTLIVTKFAPIKNSRGANGVCARKSPKAINDHKQYTSKNSCLSQQFYFKSNK